MASKKVKTYCRIIDYLESVDPDLVAIMRALCVGGVLEKTHSKTGVTFLHPTGKDFKKHLTDLAYSADITDGDKASDMINALIIRDIFKTPAEWIAKKDDIPNALYPSQRVEVKAARENEIEFENGARATIDKDFAAANRRNNLAIWKITGEMPVTKDKPASCKYIREVRRPRKVGEYEGSGSATIRRHIEQLAVASFANVRNAPSMMMRDKIGGAHEFGGKLPAAWPLEGHRKNIFIEWALSLAYYIFAIQQNLDLFYECVLPVMSLDVSDFYILFEPFKDEGEFLVPTDVIESWWSARPNFSFREAIKLFYDGLKTRGGDCAIYMDRLALFSRVNAVRQELLNEMNARPRECCAAIARRYSELEASNKIGEMKFMPDRLAEYYRSQPGLKQIHDEVRYISYIVFQTLDEPLFDFGRYKEIVGMYSEYLRAPYRHPLINENTIRNAVAPTDKVEEIMVFVNSTCFMYYPLATDEIASPSVKTVVVRPDPREFKYIWNILRATQAGTQRLIGTENNADLARLAEFVNKLNPDSIPEDIRAILKSSQVIGATPASN